MTQTTKPELIQTATTKDGATAVSIWAQAGQHRGRKQTVYTIEFVHAIYPVEARRSITWATKATEAEARVEANRCFRRWN